MSRIVLSLVFTGVIFLFLGVCQESRALEISQSHPLFVFPSPTPDPSLNTSEGYVESLVNAWNSLPQFYQAHGTMSIPHIDADMTTRGEWTQSVLKLLKEREIPLSVAIGDGARKHFFLPDTIESLLKDHSSIQALIVNDFRFDTQKRYGDLDPLALDPHVEWLKFVVSLTAKYEKKIIIRLGGLNPLLMTSNPAYRSLYDTLAANRDAVILVYLQGGRHTIVGNTSLMGLWLEGAIGQWGITVDSPAYGRAGFVEPGVFGRASVSNTASSQHSSVYRGWLLNGAIMGATVYVFDDADELWAGGHTRYWGQAIAPTLLELVHKGYIARQDLVKRAAPVAYRVKSGANWGEFGESLVDLDGVFREGRMMHGVYGLELPGQVPEWIPNTGRYYYVPILSPYASDDVLFSFKEVMMPGAVLTTEAWSERLDGYYTADGEGTAFIKKMGRAFFVFHTRENVEETQTYTLSGVPAPLHDISATREGGSVTVTWPFREGDVSYSVYRVVNPNLDAMHSAEFVEVAGGIDSRSFVDEGIAPGETVAYSVTALTNERGELSGTVNYGEYLTISSVESRLDAFAFIEPYTMRSRTVNGIAADMVEPMEILPWRRMPESDEEHVQRAGEAIAQTLLNFSDRFKREDLDGLMDLILDGYSDAAGTSKLILRDLFGSLFEGHRAGPVHHQMRAWELNDFEFSGEIIVNLFVQLTALEDSDALVPHPVRSFPGSGDGEFEITFYEDHDGSWKIKETKPPLLRVGDIVGR
ncbi:MAG: hypothetical protein VCB26_08625 [Candidatus Hydrogenedentota bacterium]